LANLVEEADTNNADLESIDGLYMEIQQLIAEC